MALPKNGNRRVLKDVEYKLRGKVKNNSGLILRLLFTMAFLPLKRSVVADSPRKNRVFLRVPPDRYIVKDTNRKKYSC